MSPRRFLAVSAVAGALLDVEMEALSEGTGFVSGAKSAWKIHYKSFDSATAWKNW